MAALRLIPQVYAPFANCLFDLLSRTAMQISNSSNTNLFQPQTGLLTYPRDTARIKWRKKLLLLPQRHVQVTVRFSFVSCHFCNHFVPGKSEGNRQSCFSYDLLPQING